ncbi:MAG: decaprenyl-phosphate phosphoribosyltransferase [Candidatus Omnitrophota bacterium]
MTDLFIAMRPKQWAKNLILFAGIIFSGYFFDPARILVVLTATAVFCAASSGLYLINDVLDAEIDRRHPVKRHRPVASGRLKSSVAHGLGYALALWAVFAAFLLNRPFGLVLSAYVALEFLYSVSLKNVVILDIFCIAAGFFLRVIAGAVVIDVPISHWLLICSTFLSLFLALAKRRSEIVLLETQAADHRPVLAHYSLPFIDQMMTVVTASTILSYVFYAFSPQTAEKFHTSNLQYSVIFVVYGIFRYLYLVFQKKEGGAPERVLFSDKPLLMNMVFYVGAVVAAVYFS